MTQFDQIFLDVRIPSPTEAFYGELRDSLDDRNHDIASRFVKAPSDKVINRHAVLAAAGTLCHSRLPRSLESQWLRNDAFLLFQKELEVFPIDMSKTSAWLPSKVAALEE